MTGQGNCGTIPVDRLTWPKSRFPDRLSILLFGTITGDRIMSKQILLTQGKVAIIDDDDYEAISEHKWLAHKSGLRMVRYYAERQVRYGTKQVLVGMHRDIMGLVIGDGLQIDHANGDGLDNRRSNLRICTQSQNNANSRRLASDRSCNFRGVQYVSRARTKPWLARIRCKNKLHYLGYFATEEEAARVYDKKSMEFFGEFARTNFDRCKYYSP